MAIIDLAGIVAGLQPPTMFIKTNLSGILAAGSFGSWWNAAGGFPPQLGAYDGTLNGITLTAPQVGQLPYLNPPSGNAYLSRLEINCAKNAKGSAGSWMTGFMLCDRLWHNGGYTITSTSAQNITSPTWPARDINGATDGDGVFLAVEISSGTGVGTPTITVSYTNSDGVAGRTANNVVPTITSVGPQTAYLIGLQAGDTGVRSVESLTLSATWTSGAIRLIAYRPIVMVSDPPLGVTQMADGVMLGLPRLFDGSVLYAMWTVDGNPFATLTMQGQLQVAQG